FTDGPAPGTHGPHPAEAVMRDRLDRWRAAIARHSWHGALWVSAELAVLVGLAGIVLALMPLGSGQATRPATPYCSFIFCGAVTPSPTQPHARPQPISDRIPVARASKISRAAALRQSLPITAPPTASPSSPPPPCSPGRGHGGGYPGSGC